MDTAFTIPDLTTWIDTTGNTWTLHGDGITVDVLRPVIYLDDAVRSDGDVSVLCLIDSTGNSQKEWPGLFADLLAARYPNATVLYYEWCRDGADAWPDMPVTVQVGTDRTITVWNSGRGGYGAVDFTANPTELIDYPDTVDHIVTGIGINSVTREDWDALIPVLTVSWPDASITITAQNPLDDDDFGPGEHAQICRDVAAAYLTGLIDVEQAFIDTGDPGALVPDGAHPNNAGQALWAATVEEAWIDSAMPPTRLHVAAGMSWIDAAGNAWSIPQANVTATRGDFDAATTELERIR